MQMYGNTDIGLVRTSNQDSLYIDKDNLWAVVADGMGGHQGGETASTLTIDVIKREMAENVGLKDAITKANVHVYEESLNKPQLSGMGTTVVLCKLDKNVATIAHVGDSRAYVVNSDGFKQITVDHSIVQQLIDSGTITKEQAKYHPQRNLITRAVGTERNVDIDINTVSLNCGDVILMCSDGLSSYVDEEEIYKIVKENTIEDAVDKLIKSANDAGGKDNVTVLLIKA